MLSNQGAYLMIDVLTGLKPFGWLGKRSCCSQCSRGFSEPLIFSNVTVNESGICVTRVSSVSQRCRVTHWTADEFCSFSDGFLLATVQIIGWWEICLVQFLNLWENHQPHGGRRPLDGHVHPALIRCDDCIITGSWIQSDRMLGIVVSLWIESM